MKFVTPTLHERRVLRSSGCVRSGLLGRYPNLLRRYHATLEPRQRSTEMTLKSGLVCESKKMRVPFRFR